MAAPGLALQVQKGQRTCAEHSLHLSSHPAWRSATQQTWRPLFASPQALPPYVARGETEAQRGEAVSGPSGAASASTSIGPWEARVRVLGDPRGKWEPGRGQTLELSQAGTMNL